MAQVRGGPESVRVWVPILSLPPLSTGPARGANVEVNADLACAPPAVGRCFASRDRSDRPGSWVYGASRKRAPVTVPRATGHHLVVDPVLQGLAMLASVSA
jgi:hypothetical protein